MARLTRYLVRLFVADAMTLFALSPPVRLRAYATGIYPDGWMPETSTYRVFASGHTRPTTVHVRLSRYGLGPSEATPVLIRVFRLTDASKRPIRIVRLSVAGQTGRAVTLARLAPPVEVLTTSSRP